ncbi:unnamed protein product [Tuber melanosporum]|uniref:(Perigord truffle) hypothetical protein n=1 Tax=Tuber melanosporum (strain Mel28) TaxID=656061 RepID=D5G4E0_TUBMM|nr:uncharacterized protein GSTUM_00004066001 [Tuber melanosporum]CAZ79383.1 unnamed protein product [Tuber melanosporum]
MVIKFYFTISSFILRYLRPGPPSTHGPPPSMAHVGLNHNPKDWPNPSLTLPNPNTYPTGIGLVARYDNYYDNYDTYKYDMLRTSTPRQLLTAIAAREGERKESIKEEKGSGTCQDISEISIFGEREQQRRRRRRLITTTAGYWYHTIALPRLECWADY